MSLNKSYPHSLEAEMAVLGSMMMSKDSIDTISEIIKSEYFYLDNHKKIFDAIISLNDKRKPVELLTLSEELKKNNQLEEIGGQKYLAELLEYVTTTAHSQNYAYIVKEKYILRELIKSSTKIVEKAYEQTDDIDKILDTAQSYIFDISQKSIEHGFEGAKQLANNYIERLSKLYKNKSAVTGVPTGFKDFDEMTGGLQNSEMVIIAARPSQGKTAMALNITYHVAVECKIPVVFFSLEMDRMSLVNRMICASAGLNVGKVRHGNFDRQSFELLTTEAAKLSEGKIWIDDTSSLSIMDIRARTRKLMLELKAKDPKFDKMLVIIDYLQLIRGTGRYENRQQEVSEISKLLKDMARSLNIPVLALSQLNRRTEDRSREGNKPQLSDLRESGSLEQDSDIVALIHRDYYYTKDESQKNKALLIVAKNRNGAVGDVDLNFIAEYTKFCNPPPAGIENLIEETPL